MVGDLTPTPVPQGTTIVVSTSDSSPTSVYTVYKATQRVSLKGITISNTQTPGNPEQVFVGVRYESGSGTADWVPMIAPAVDGGEVFAWNGNVYLGSGDEVVSYGSVGNYSTVTLEIEVT